MVCSMRRADSIFDSRPERELYRALQSRWRDIVALYPQQPLTKLIVADRGELSNGEWQFYLHANVDYTVCIRGRAVFSVEFDGIGRGFSREGRYIPARDVDRLRRRFLGDKLAWCERVGYPLVVISEPEAARLDRSDELCVVDGLIGQVLFRERFSDEVSLAVELASDRLADLTEAARQEAVIDIAEDVEFDVEREIDLLQMRLLRSWKEAMPYGFSRFGGQQRGLDAPERGLVGWEVRYDEVGVCERVWVRAVDALKGTLDTRSIAMKVSQWRALDSAVTAAKAAGRQPRSWDFGAGAAPRAVRLR
jgi:hypothetical protein